MTIAVNRNLSNCEIAPKKVFLRGFFNFSSGLQCIESTFHYEFFFFFQGPSLQKRTKIQRTLSTQSSSPSCELSVQNIFHSAPAKLENETALNPVDKKMFGLDDLLDLAGHMMSLYTVQFR